MADAPAQASDAPTGSRMFTQSEVDRIVSDRVQAEKRSWEQRASELRGELRAAEERAETAEQLQRRVDALTKERNDARELAKSSAERAVAAQIRAEVTAVATRAGAVDADDIYRLLPGTPTVNAESGAIEGVEQLVSQLSESKPHLFQPQRQPPPPDGGARHEGGREPGADGGPGMNELIRRAAGRA